MHGNEEFIPWLTQKLNAEREDLRKQQIQHCQALERRHKELLAEMEAKLRKAAGSAPQPIADTLATDTPQESESSSPVKQGNLLKKNAPPELTDASEKDSPAKPSPGARSSQSSQSSQSSVARRSSSYKHRALKNLAGQGSFSTSSNDPLVRRIVKTPWFEALSGMLILLNTMILAFEIEYYGFDSGNSVGYKHYQSSPETWPGLEVWFDYLDYLFVFFFTVELFMRIGADGWRSFRSAWIWFDAIIILASVVSWFGFGPGSNEDLDPTLLRIARLARMLRALKMIRLVRAFDSLFLLIRSIQASVGALFWSFVLLIAVEVAIGMVISQLLRQYIQDESKSVIKRREVFLLYGTFTRTMLTMFEITLGNWVPSCRTLMNNVSEWFALFYILYCCCFIFAVIRVIQAVFIAETNRLVAADDQIAVMRKQRDKEAYLKKLHIMFEELDLSGDGQLSIDEVKEMSDDKLLKAMMSTLDINVHDLETLFYLLDDGDGMIDVDEFIKGLPRVKGGAQSIDVVTLLKMTKNLNRKTDMLIEKVKMMGGQQRLCII